MVYRNYRSRKKIIEKLKPLAQPALGLAILAIVATQMVELNSIAAEVDELKEQIAAPAITIIAPERAEPKITQEPVEEPPSLYTAEDVELIGRTIWGEAGGVQSKAERAAVAWCILNRVDAFDQTIEEVVTAPQQFQGYRPEGECPQEHLELAADVLARWEAERYGEADVGRVLPADYLYFLGDGKRNHFTNEWQSTEYWGWTMDNPYL